MSDADESPPESGEIPGLPWQAEKKDYKGRGVLRQFKK